MYALELWSLEASVPKRLWKVDQGCEYVDVSNDGTCIAVAGCNALRVLDASTGRTLSQMKSAPFSREPRPCLHPTHPYLLLHSYFSPQFQIRNWESGTVVLDVKPGKARDDYPGNTGSDWSPDGLEFVVASGHDEAMHWFKFDPQRGVGRLARTFKSGTDGSGGGPQLAYLPGGDRLLHVGWNNRVQILDAHTEVCSLNPRRSALASRRITLISTIFAAIPTGNSLPSFGCRIKRTALGR